MASRTAPCFEFSIQAMVRGYHVYQDEWDAVIGEVLQCRRETGNRHDPYAVATLSDGRVVGHVPRKISPVCSIFIRRGGSITCTVSDRRRYSTDLEQGGLEIPCKIKFSTSSLVEKEKAEKLVTAALSNNETNGLSHQELKAEAQESKTTVTTHTDAARPRVCGEIAKIEKSDQVGDVVVNLYVEDSKDDPTVKPPPMKKSRLHYEAIIMGEMLSDIHINMAQAVLKVQFSKLNGFESTLYQGKEVKWMEEKITMKVQIVHCKDRKNWILATTVDCPRDVVKVYDSMFGFLDQETKEVIKNLFTVSNSPLQIKMMKSQKQTGCTDCGVFSVANATTIAFGLNPAKQTLQQDRMRAHLVSCLQKKEFSLFPSM